MSTNSGETTIMRRPDYAAGGKGVDGGRGWAWIAESWQFFKRAPGTWIGIVVVFAVLFFGLGLIPVVGALASVVLQPVLAAGIVTAAARADNGEPPRFDDLFTGFRARFGKLATVGAIYLAGTLVIVVGAILSTGLGIASLAHGGNPDPALAGALLLTALIVMALMLPLVMAVWFAAPLVLFHDEAPVAAMKASFSGCLKNIVPFLVYGVIAVAFGILASIPLMLGWLVLGPVLAISLYTSYRDIYLA